MLPRSRCFPDDELHDTKTFFSLHSSQTSFPWPTDSFESPTPRIPRERGPSRRCQEVGPCLKVSGLPLELSSSARQALQQKHQAQRRNSGRRRECDQCKLRLTSTFLQGISLGFSCTTTLCFFCERWQPHACLDLSRSPTTKRSWRNSIAAMSSTWPMLRRSRRPSGRDDAGASPHVRTHLCGPDDTGASSTVTDNSTHVSCPRTRRNTAATP